MKLRRSFHPTVRGRIAHASASSDSLIARAGVGHHVRWLAICSIAVLAVGCASDPTGAPSSPPTSGTEPKPIPDLQPVTAAVPARAEPRGLTAGPDAGDVVSLSKQSSESRVAAETFALRLSQSLIDSRSTKDLGDLLDAVAVREFSPDLRASLLDEAASQAQLGLGRRWKYEAPMWMRSEVAGSEDEATRVNVEVAGTIAIKDPSYVGWNIIRLDIVRDGSSWKLAAVSAAPFRPADASIDRSTVVLGDHLEGSDWREIPPKR